MKTLLKPGIITAFGILGIGLGEIESATPLWEADGVVWGGENSYYYRPGVSGGIGDAYDGIPTDAAETTPTWIATNGVHATLHAEAGYLNITTSATYTGENPVPTGSQTSNFRNAAQWDASVAATVEVSLRINALADGASYATSITLGNGVEWTDIVFGIHADSGDLTISANRLNGVDAGEFNTLRFVMSGMESASTSKIEVYLNGGTTPIRTINSLSAATTVNYLRFGDASSTATTSGSVDFAFVRWVNGQALMPIPEPGVLGILSFAGIAFFGRGRQLRKR